jgi:hypothetical protein
MPSVRPAARDGGRTWPRLRDGETARASVVSPTALSTRLPPPLRAGRPQTKAFHRHAYVDSLADTSLAVAVDIGGTFTGIALYDARAARSRAKTPSVQPDPSSFLAACASP